MTGCIITVQRECTPKLSKDISTYLKFICLLFSKNAQVLKHNALGLSYYARYFKVEFKDKLSVSSFLAGNEPTLIMKLTFLHYHNYLRLQHIHS